MFPSNKNISNHTSQEKLFLFRIKKSESDVVNDLFLAIQNIVAGTAIVSNTLLSDTCFQYKIQLSNDSPQITLQYEMKLDEKELLVPVVEHKGIGVNGRVDDDNNTNKRNESFEITFPDKKETSFPLCCVKQEIPEVLPVLNNVENIDDKKLASFDDQTKVNHSEINSTSDSISNSDASKRKLFALLAGNSHVITPVKEEGNRTSERVMQNKRSKQIDHNDVNKYEERGAVIEKKYNCTYCDQLFKSISAKEMHEEIHTGEKLFKCEECGKAFIQPGALMMHKRFHAGDKPFTCEECGKTFYSSTYLTQHKKIHTSDKPFACEECGKAFTLLGNLTQHKKTHTDLKVSRRFNCDECGKAFTKLSSLTDHKKTHTGLKVNRLFKCEECGKDFTRLNSLNEHKKTHPGEKTFTCEECDKSFAGKKSLKRHKKNFHT